MVDDTGPQAWKNPMAWLPHAIAEAALSGGDGAADLSEAWKHLQERLYSIIPFLAKFGPGLIGEIASAVRTDCPDHQFMTV